MEGQEPEMPHGPISRPKSIPELILLYIVLPLIIIALLGSIGRGLMSDADNSYLQGFLSGFHSSKGQLFAALMENAIYIYATPVFIIPWILYEISKRFFRPVFQVLKATEVIAAFPFYLLTYPMLMIYSSLKNPEADPRDVMRGATFDETLESMVLAANVIGIAVLAALQGRVLAELMIGLICCPSVLLIFVLIFNVFRLAARPGKKVV